jgi:hypothetical protein
MVDGFATLRAEIGEPVRKPLPGMVLTVVVAVLVSALTTVVDVGAVAAADRPTVSQGAQAALVDYPWTRYRSLIRPGWCLDGDIYQDPPVYVEPCNFGPYQQWHYTAGQWNLMLYQEVNGNRWCLEMSLFSSGFRPILQPCNDSYTTQRWNARGVNGHVVYENLGYWHGNRRICIYVPSVGRYIGTDPCPDWNNVPNRYAWDYFR